MTQRKLFRTLLRLLPEETRSIYGQEMETTFEIERREAAADGGRMSLAALWLATMGDFFRTAPSEHIDILRRDTRYAWRTMAARRGHTLTALGTLALAIGANVAMFAVVDAVLLEPLPYESPKGLVAVSETEGGEDPSNLGYLTFVDLRERARSFETLVAVGASTATLTDGELDAERVNAMRVSRAYFDMLGVHPSVGRPFTEEEDRPGAARRVVILSHSLWQRRFEADRSVVGATITISGREYRVVGVMPEHFEDMVAQLEYGKAEVWYPLGYDPTASFACRTCRHLRVFGRLAPGATPEAAKGELQQLFASLESEHPSEYHEAGAQVTPLSDVFLGPVRLTLLVLWAGVGALLLIACANVANFLLLRASEREHEVAVRAALGVTPARLVRQLTTESVLLSVVGGVAGLLPAWLAVRLLAVAGPAELPRLAEVSIDARAVGVAVALAVASGVAFGLAPLRHLTRRNLQSVQGSARGTESSETWRVRSGLLALSVALAVVLLVGSGLLVRTMRGLLTVEPGFETADALTLQLWASGARFRKGDNDDQIAAAVSFYDEVLTGIEALPGVEAAAGVSTLPLGGGVDGYSIHVEGEEASNPEAVPDADRFVVTPRFFETMQIPLVRGRYLGSLDRKDSEPVVVINRTAADELFPGGALGRHVRLGPQNAAERRIVGVVSDVRHHGLETPAGYQVYVPQAQWAWAETFLTLVVRSEGEALSLVRPVREVIRSVDPSQPISQVRTYDEVLASATATRRFAARLLTLFAVAALLLALVGLYSAVGVLVGQRQREIGLRIALGARASAIRRMVLARGMKPVVSGLAIGLVATAVSVRAVRSLLFGVEAWDPAVFLVATLLLFTTALGACWLPAWRAARIDPSKNLRTE